MIPIRDYRQIALENERVFRNILSDLRDNRTKREFGNLVPSNLQTDLSVDKLFEIHSTGRRYGKFTICDFVIPQPDVAKFTFENVACLSGGGAELEYMIKPDNDVEYKSGRVIFIS